VAAPGRWCRVTDVSPKGTMQSYEVIPAEKPATYPTPAVTCRDPLDYLVMRRSESNASPGRPALQAAGIGRRRPTMTEGQYSSKVTATIALSNTFGVIQLRPGQRE
jgi:hypothetical protein